MKKLCLILACSSLFATVNEPLRWEWSMGYRSDDFHWHLLESTDGSSLYTEHYPTLQFWQNNLQLRVVHRDLTFFAQGGVGAFGSGLQEPLNIPTKGLAADGLGWFGYAVNLTADRFYRVILTPLVGYEGHVLHLHPQGSPSEQTSWNGWLFGGDISFQPVRPTRLYAGYAYHLLHARLSVKDPALCLHFSEGGNYGHSGWAEWDYCLTRFWRVGLAGTISYLFSSVQDVTVNGDLSRRLKIRWTAITGLATLSGEF